MAKPIRQSRSPLKIALVVLVGLILIAVNGAYLIAARIPASQAERSIAVAPWRGEGYSDAAVDILTDPKVASTKMPVIRAFARKALAQSPLDTGGYYALVRALEASGKTNVADELALASENISRRNPNIQMYLTSRAAKRNDIDGVMQHLNTVLRTSRSGRAVAFPILCTSLTDARSIKLIAKNLRSNANWVSPFVEQCSSSAPTIGNLAVTLLQAPSIARDSKQSVHINILANLVDQKKLELAGRYFAVVAGLNANPTGPLVDRFQRINILPYFDWTAAADGGIYVDQLDGNQGVAISTDTSMIPLMERMHALAPGRYRLTSEVRALTLPAQAELFWTVQCYGVDGSLGTLPLKVTKFPQSVSFDVPFQGCPAQQLRLRSAGAGQSREISGEIPFVKIERIGSVREAGAESQR